MDLRKLEYFEAVCRYKNFTKAAEELHVAQPSITASIMKLEEELGVALLQRNQRSVTITREGELLLMRAAQLLSDVQNVMNEMKDLGSRANRTLKLAIPTSLGAWMFPTIFSDYTRQYPHIQLEVHEFGVQNIIDNLEAETIELGFIVLSDPLPAYETSSFSRGQLLVIFPKDHPFTNLEKIPFELLASERFILCSGGSYIRNKIMSECTQYGFKPQIVFTPRQVATAFNMVASGAGISFVLADEIAVLKENPHIMMRPLEKPITFETGFIWKKNRYLSAVARDFIQFMKNKKGV